MNRIVYTFNYCPIRRGHEAFDDVYRGLLKVLSLNPATEVTCQFPDESKIEPERMDLVKRVLREHNERIA